MIESIKGRWRVVTYRTALGWETAAFDLQEGRWVQRGPVASDKEAGDKDHEQALGWWGRVLDYEIDERIQLPGRIKTRIRGRVLRSADGVFWFDEEECPWLFRVKEGKAAWWEERWGREIELVAWCWWDGPLMLCLKCCEDEGGDEP